MLCSRQRQRILGLDNATLITASLLTSTPPQPSHFLHTPNPLFTTNLQQPHSLHQQVRHASSSSSTRWKTRQTNDHFAKEARVAGLKSRAAFKLLELDSKHRIFKKGGTVVDLGYAPGSWSQVAVNRTSPGGRVVGIDIIPAQPPRGASSIQGNFLSREIQEEVRNYVQDYWKGRARKRGVLARRVGKEGEEEEEDDEGEAVSEDEVDALSKGIIDMGRDSSSSPSHSAEAGLLAASAKEEQQQLTTTDLIREEEMMTQAEKDDRDGRVVDVVLSDMSAPWDQTTGTWIRSVNNPYRRMMNTSGIPFRDHAGSMDLCNAALTFSYSTLRTGGHFLCKFYQGAEEKPFELRLRRLFEKVHREKPESSRSASKEAYFVALRRKPDVDRRLVFPDEY